MLVRFNEKEKEPVFIETAHVSMVKPYEDGSIIYFLGGDYQRVTDTVERVVQIVNNGMS